MVCSRGESLTQHTNQRKLFNAIAAAAVIGTSLITANPAQARGCYVSMATMDMDSLIAGGASLKQAYQYAVSNGNLDGSDMCWIKLKGFSKSVQHVYPALYRAIWM